MARRGLWFNIRAKRKRGGKPRKPGQKGRPTDKAFRDSQSSSTKKSLKFG